LPSAPRVCRHSRKPGKNADDRPRFEAIRGIPVDIAHQFLCINRFHKCIMADMPSATAPAQREDASGKRTKMVGKRTDINNERWPDGRLSAARFRISFAIQAGSRRYQRRMTKAACVTRSKTASKSGLPPERDLKANQEPMPSTALPIHIADNQAIPRIAGRLSWICSSPNSLALA
jgi:hypothetical protein